MLRLAKTRTSAVRKAELTVRSGHNQVKTNVHRPYETRYSSCAENEVVHTRNAGYTPCRSEHHFYFRNGHEVRSSIDGDRISAPPTCHRDGRSAGACPVSPRSIRDGLSQREIISPAQAASPHSPPACSQDCSGQRLLPAATQHSWSNETAPTAGSPC